MFMISRLKLKGKGVRIQGLWSIDKILVKLTKVNCRVRTIGQFRTIAHFRKTTHGAPYTSSSFRWLANSNLWVLNNDSLCYRFQLVCKRVFTKRQIYQISRVFWWNKIKYSKFSFYIQSLDSLQESTMDYRLTMFLRMWWIDPRLSFNSTEPRIQLIFKIKTNPFYIKYRYNRRFAFIASSVLMLD